jgi:hypothetical protein
LERTTVHKYDETGWAPKPVQTLRGREKSFASAEIGTPDRRARSLIVVPTTLSHFPVKDKQQYLNTSLQCGERQGKILLVGMDTKMNDRKVVNNCIK